MIKKHMTKKDVKRIKAIAKKRRNRRLSDAEAVRVMAQYNSQRNRDNGLVASDSSNFRLSSDNDSIQRGLLGNYYNIEGYRVNENGSRYNQKVNNLSKILSDTTEVKSETKIPNKNRRLSDKSYRSLMKKAADVLGINNRKTLPIINLDAPSKEREMTTEEMLYCVLSSISRQGLTDIIKKYKTVVKNKKLTIADKLNILNYIYYGGNNSRYLKTPMALISENQKINAVRRVVKKWGDIKRHATRYIPDEEFYQEIKGKKRTKRDYFDKMDDDKKIEWARHANLVIGFGGYSRNPNFIDGDFKVRTEDDYNTAMFAMKYACKAMKIPEFKGGFANPFWVLLRTWKNFNKMTKSEFDVWTNVAFDHLGINTKKFLPMINQKQALEKITPTLKNLNLYNEFVKSTSDSKNRFNKFRIATELIRGTTNEDGQRD